MQHNYRDDGIPNTSNLQPIPQQVTTWATWEDNIASQHEFDPQAHFNYSTLSNPAYPTAGYPAAYMTAGHPAAYMTAGYPTPSSSTEVPTAYPALDTSPSYTPATRDSYSRQHAMLNAYPGSTPVLLYPPSHAGPPVPYPGSPSTLAASLPTHPDDSDPDAHPGEGSSRHRGWSQHITQTGAPRERIAVACDNCRSRKIRCDGTTPTCSKCRRAGIVCQYQPEPGRRGPDQVQRTRGPPGQRKPRSSARREQDDSSGNPSGYPWGTY